MLAVTFFRTFSNRRGFPSYHFPMRKNKSFYGENKIKSTVTVGGPQPEIGEHD